MRLPPGRLIALVSGSALLAGTLVAPPASAAVATTNFTTFCIAKSIIGDQKQSPATSMTVDAPDAVSPGETFSYTIQPGAGSYPNSASGATTTNLSRLKLDYEIPGNATFVNAEIVAGTGYGLGGVAPSVLRVNTSGSADAAGSILRVSGGNQTIGNGPSTSENSEGGITVPKSKKDLSGNNSADGSTWFRMPTMRVTMVAGSAGSIQPKVRTSGSAGNQGDYSNFSTQLAKASFLGTQWAPTRCSPRDTDNGPLNAGAGPLATIQIVAAPVDEDTATTLAAPATAVAGSPVELEATVSPNPGGGTVQFTSNGANIGSPVVVSGGKATLSHTFATAGSRSVRAVFSGTSGFTGSTSAARPIEVSDPSPVDEDTTTTLTAPASATTGDAVELKATVAPNPGGGTVQFTSNGVNIGSPVAVSAGQATMSHTFTTSGDRALRAVFSGAPGFTGSTSAVRTIEVSGSTPSDQDTTTTLTAPSSATAGDAVQLEATVAPNPGGGTVQFTSNGADIGSPVAVSGGKATLSHTFATAGSRSVRAVYSGTAGFAGSTSASSTIAVSGSTPSDQDTTTTLDIPAKATTGLGVTLKAAVSPNPGGGTVQFSANGVNIGSAMPVVNGEASLNYEFLSPGDRIIRAVFSGAPGFNGSPSEGKSLEVVDEDPQDGDTTTTLAAPSTSIVGAEVELRATVAPALDGGTVQFTSNGTAIGDPIAVVNGVATLKYTFATAGEREIRAVYSGTTGHAGSTSTPKTITVTTSGGTDGGGSGSLGSGSLDLTAFSVLKSIFG